MAYKIKGLADKLKTKGLDLAEDAVKIILDTASEWALEEADKGEHGLVDTIVKVAIPQVSPVLKDQADKIDGVIGN